MRVDSSVDEPFNREPPVEELIQSFITKDDGYERNHGPFPYIEAEQHVVRVDGDVHNPLTLTIDQLRTQFAQHKVTSLLQCAGNRRHTMRTRLKDVDGIDWGDAAVMNCEWGGPRLKDVLERAQLRVETGHVAFSCYQTPVQDADWYGGSIELARAIRLEADVLVALQMNGQPLPVKHGFPVRILVPGVSGCRSVKWLDRITVQAEESNNMYQRYDYKRLPPEVTDAETAKRYWDHTPALQDMPINSVIALPKTGATVTLSADGTLETRGYALPQSDQGPVIKVEVSADGGETWEMAVITNGGDRANRYAWVFWKAIVRLKKGRQRLLSRATDQGGNTQPSDPVWNLRGVGYDGYGEARDLTVV